MAPLHIFNFKSLPCYCTIPMGAFLAELKRKVYAALEEYFYLRIFFFIFHILLHSSPTGQLIGLEFV